VTILIWAIALAISSPSIVVAAELTARWLIRRRARYYVLPPGMRLRLEPDPGVSPHMEAVVRFEVNRDGERGGAPPRSRHLYRVLVAGGSQPEGYLLDQDTSWPGALQRVLEAPERLDVLRTRHVHVGSIARSGVGSEALDLMFERLLPRYRRLSAIIVLVGASDVLRWLEFDAPSSPPPAVRTSEVFRCHPELAFGWRPARLALVECVRRLRHRWLRPVQVHQHACRWIARARAMRAHAATVRAIAPDPAPMLAHFDHHFRRALARAKAHADRVIVVRQPWFDRPHSAEERALMWHGGVGQAWQEHVSTFYSHEVLSTLMAALDARAASIARELEIEQLDLMPILERSARTYYDFFHATPAGSRAIAAAVAATVLREPLPRPATLAAVGECSGADTQDFRQKVS
jgi:hypothetical protein